MNQVSSQDTHSIGLHVPAVEVAYAHMRDIVGAANVERANVDALWVSTPQSLRVRFRPSERGAPATPPAVTDLGTQHLCWRVADIESAASYLDSLAGVRVLGDIIEMPEGPLTGNKWVYYRSPWGTLFELQQWPEEPYYQSSTSIRLDHTMHTFGESMLPTFAGLDHVGYSVPDLDAAIGFLAESAGAEVALRATIEADRAFMNAQFEADTEGYSHMAFLNVGGLNVELFEHHVPDQLPMRDPQCFGDHNLSPRGHDQDIAARLLR